MVVLSAFLCENLRLNAFYRLKEPYTKQIKSKIRELRIRGRQGAIRILYFAHTGRRLILLHGFVKKTDKTPINDIETAEKRMNDFINRQRG